MVTDHGGALTPNRCSFTFKKPRKGKRGGEMVCCQLVKEVFVRVDTPTYERGMDHSTARAAWEAYLRSISRFGTITHG